MAKLGLGFYRGGGDIPPALKRLGANCALLFGTALGEAGRIKAVNPRAILVGRYDIPDADRPTWLDRGYEGGVEFAEQILTAHADLPIDYWTSLCEGPVDPVKTALFELGFTRRMHKAAKNTCVLNWAVGNGTIAEMSIPEMHLLFQEADALGVHAYGSDNLKGGTGLMSDQAIWYALCWRQWESAYRQNGWQFPKVFLTEFGTHYSWRSGGEPPPVFVKSPEEVARDFRWLGQIIEADGNVLGAAAFGYGFVAGTFSGFNLEFESVVLDAMREWNLNHPGGGTMPQPLNPVQIHTIRDNLWKDAGASGFNPNTALTAEAAKRGYVPYGPEHYDLLQPAGIVYQGFYGAQDGVLVAWANEGFAVTEGLPLPPA